MSDSHWSEEEGLLTLRLDALERLGGLSARFTGRRGGVSNRWEAGCGLNWSVSVGDEPAQVRENRRRSLALLGLPVEAGVMAGLVHGDRVVALTGTEGATPGDVGVVPSCDGLITDQVGLALIATAADCVPIYLYDPVRRAIGVAHAGWRGTVAGIAGKTAQAMVAQYGCQPGDIHAAVGPSIGPCCYEVDEAVAGPLRQHYGPGADALLTPGKAPGKYQLDLWAANRLDLERAGLTDVTIAGACTSCQVDRLFSHRAESGQAGRGAALIAMQP